MTGSAAKTYTRGAYHEARFYDLRRELDKRRAMMPGEIIWDSLIEYVHFELQAFSAACRTLLDELVYIVARRHGHSPKHARRDPWSTADLFKKALPLECQVPEVHELRIREAWFDTLNAFRNSFFHHGWRHGGGHFSPDEVRASSKFPSSNGLMVPDRESLTGRAKPFEWTWKNGTTVDEIARLIREGMEGLLDGILGTIWNSPIPQPGTAPPDERPNIIVGLVRPAFVVTPTALIVPIFSSRDRGLSFRPDSGTEEIELVDAPLSSLVLNQRAASFSVSGLEQNKIPEGITQIDIILDPVQNGNRVDGAIRTRVDIQAFLSTGSINPISIVLPDLERIWLWRPVELRPWWGAA